MPRKKTTDNEKKKLTQWHPVFLKSLQLLVNDAVEQTVEVQDEISLSSNPLRIDNVVILSHNNIKLEHPITWIFDLYNMIEFKSPNDYLRATDFDKLIACARLHQVLKNPNEDLLEHYTINYFCTTYPRKMIKRLKKRGLQVKAADPVDGIYRVYGEMYRIQIVIFNKISDPELAWIFAPFITDEALTKLQPYIKLATRMNENPGNQAAVELFNFSADKGLIPMKQLEVIFCMLKEMSEEERKAYYALFDQAEALEPWRKQLRDDGWGDGVVFGEVKKSREFIQKLLSRKFSDCSANLQSKVIHLHTPEILDFVLEELFAASTLKEAEAVINDGIADESKRQNIPAVVAGSRKKEKKQPTKKD